MYHNKRVIDTAYAVLTSDVMLASYRDFFADWVYEQTDPVGFLTSQLPACAWLVAPELPKEDPSPMDTSISMELFMAAFQREARWREQFDAMMAQAMKYTAYIVRKALGLDDDKLFDGVENYIANSGLDIAKDKASAYVAQWLAKEFPPILRVSEVIVQCSDAAVKNHENRSIVEEKLRGILNLLKQDCNAAFLRTIGAKTPTKTIDARDAALLVFFNRATPSLLHTTTKSQTSILRSELFDAEKELHENYPFTDLCWNLPCAAFKDLEKQANNQLGQTEQGL